MATEHAIIAPGAPSQVAVYQKKTILTDAQIKSLPTTPIEVVSSPGAGKILVYANVSFVLNWFGDYGNIDGDVLMFLRPTGATNGQASSLPLKDAVNWDVTNLLMLSESAANIGVPPNSSFATTQPLNQIENKGLELFIQNSGSGNLTGGHANNTLSVTVFYSIVDL